MREIEMTTITQENETLPEDMLQAIFGDRLQRHVNMSRFSSARVGGPADYLVVAHSADQLEQDLRALWRFGIPYRLLGGASNVLVSERGLPGLVLINHARGIGFQTRASRPVIRAESGALMSTIVQRAAAAGLSGLEWATALPGTLGGAIYGNAGAFGSEISTNLIVAEILHAGKDKTEWNCEDFVFQYRSSILKRQSNQDMVILSAELQLQHGNPQDIRSLMAALKGKREIKQPPGACTGSMFKNPSGDFAGRLIEAAGLKGTKAGDVEISLKHGNFFINNGMGTADDFYQLIRQTRDAVANRFGVHLELEVELLGNWELD